MPARTSALPHVIGEGRNIEFLNVSDAGEALDILRRSYRQQESLDLMLILLDARMSEQTRGEAAQVLSNSLRDSNLRSWLEGVLYAAPLPSAADMEGAMRHAQDSGGATVTPVLSRLSVLQNEIALVHEAWVSVCARILPSVASRKEATVLATRNSIFRHLVHACEEGSGRTIDEFRYAALLALQPVRNHRQIVEELVGELPISRKAAPRASAENETTERILDANDKDAQRVGFDRAAAFERVYRQKLAIVNYMRAGRFDLVERFVDELVEFQLPLDHRGELTSKSLCDLAMEAKSLGLFELQLALARRAVTVCYEDGWAWAQVGDAFLILNRFGDALTAYRRAGEFAVNSEVGRTGYAHALFRMGRLNESLEAFEEIIRDYPVALVARNGRAEVLGSMGMFDEALDAYDAVVQDFPTNIVAKIGRADVLKSMGRFDEALAAYDAIAREFPANVNAKNGRAGVLKAMGRLDEALAAYDAILKDFPDIVSKNEHAELLRSMGQLDAALAAYDVIVREFPRDIVAKIGRAEMLKSLARFDDALAAYDIILREFPRNAVAMTGRADLLRSAGHLEEALAVYNAIVDEFPTDVVAKIGQAEVLTSMGNYDQALTIYDAVAHDYPTNVIAKTGRAEVLRSAGRLSEALVAYDAIILDFPMNIVAKNGRAEVLRSMGQLNEALDTYEAIVRAFPTNIVAKIAASR